MTLIFYMHFIHNSQLTPISYIFHYIILLSYLCARSSMRVDSVVSSSTTASSSRSSSQSSPPRPIQQPPATSAINQMSSFTHPPAPLATMQPETLSSSVNSRLDAKSANAWPPNIPTFSHPGEMSATSRLPNSQSSTRPAGLSASNQPGSLSAYNQPFGTSADSQPGKLSASGRPFSTSAENRPDAESAGNWPPNVPTSSHDGDMLADSLGIRWVYGVSGRRLVPLQAKFNLPVIPRRTTMTVVATHVDERCNIYVHQLHGGLCPYWLNC